MHGCERIKTIGDAVNTASRMESESKAMHINISNKTRGKLQGQYALTPHAKTVKGKGRQKMFYLDESRRNSR